MSILDRAEDRLGMRIDRIGSRLSAQLGEAIRNAQHSTVWLLAAGIILGIIAAFLALRVVRR